ncbi:MAG: MFS transporter [Paracoccaceae bacterium]
MAEISARKRIWGWYFFDWASQPYHTLIVTFVFGPYFASVAADYYLGQGMEAEAAGAAAQTIWAWGLGVAGILIAFGAPVMGALADSGGNRRPWILAFSVMYAVGAYLLWYTMPDGSNMIMALLFFSLGFVGAEFALIFINAQLPDLGTDEEVGEISGTGFAFGYLGGLISLILMLALFVEQGNGKTIAGLDPILGLDPTQREGSRSVGPFSAIWFVIFMIPYFLWCKEQPRSGHRIGFGQAIGKVIQSIRALGSKKSLLAYLGSSMFYRDALNGLYGFGGVYAGLVLGWEITQIGIFGIVALISSAVFSWFGGKADKRLGPKPVIVRAILVLIAVCVIIVGMSRTSFFGLPLAEGSNLPDFVFFGCGVLIGGMGGILQAASRSLMVRHCPPDAPTESFGLYGLSGRATAFIAPMLVAITTTATGSARLGISPVVILFLIGLVLLVWVKAEGER